MVRITTDCYRLCYSLHSSYSEICTLLKQISPNRVHPIALPNYIDVQRFDQLLLQLGIKNQRIKQSVLSSPIEPQIKARHRCSNKRTADALDDNHDLDFDGHDHRIHNEKQLYKRISDLQQSSVKKGE